MDVQKFQNAINRVGELHKQRDYNSDLKLVEELLVHYPCSVDLLVKYAKLIQLSDNESDEVPPLEAAPESLKLAHIISLQSIEPCIELGYLEYGVNNCPDQAIQYFKVAQSKAEAGLKEALIGQIKCYIDMEQISHATDLLERAKILFVDDIDLKMIEAELE